MNFNELEEKLLETFADGRLSVNEKRELSVIALNCTLEQRRYLRNRAFDIYQETLQSSFSNQDKNLAMEGLRWLEKTLKAIDATEKTATAYFSPGEDCRNKIIELLRCVNTSLDICVFTISDDRLTAAILDVYQRGIDVRIISDNDKAEDRGSDIYKLIEQGVPLRIDNTTHHMHHKFAIFDKTILLNGSFNWTRSATRYNQENILVSYDRNALGKYQENFDSLWLAYGAQ